jgi:hypothetical protein
VHGAKVQPALNALRCSADKTASCLSAAQIGALTRLMQGAQDSKGNSLYAEWAWDAGIGSPGWRVWKLGNADGRPPALNVILGGASLASDFTTPPTPVSADPQRLFQFLLGFDFDRDAPAIYATNAEFPRSAWDDISARSSDLSGFRAHHGKLMVPHGVSDPVFSVNDTLAWWHEVDKRNAGHADTFVRVFPVPGMNHCGGGAATDRYDVLASLTQWVEKGSAPAEHSRERRTRLALAQSDAAHSARIRRWRGTRAAEISRAQRVLFAESSGRGSPSRGRVAGKRSVTAR